MLPSLPSSFSSFPSLFPFFFFILKWPHSPSWLWTHCLVQDDLELCIFPPSLQLWQTGVHHHTQWKKHFGIESSTSHMLDRHSARWAALPTMWSTLCHFRLQCFVRSTFFLCLSLWNPSASQSYSSWCTLAFPALILPGFVRCVLPYDMPVYMDMTEIGMLPSCLEIFTLLY